MTERELSRREKLHALYLVTAYRPKLTAFIVLFGLLVTVLEAVGISFIIPITEVAQESGPPATDGDGFVATFAAVYQTLGIPFTLGYVIVGVTCVLTVRYMSSIVVDWLKVALRTNYVRDLQAEAFRSALDARVEYFDREGSDDILNAIVTQAEYAGKVIRDFVRLFRTGLLILMYAAIALYFAPVLTGLSALFVVLTTVVIRDRLEAGYTVGGRVAEANERIQESVQAGTQGIREVKLLGIDDDLYDTFETHLENFTASTIRLGRNEAIIRNVYNLLVAVMLFVLIYAALRFTSLSLGALAAFLFVMFRLGPAVSRANKWFYKIEGRLPHLVRTQRFIDELERSHDVAGGDTPVPDDPTPIAFEDVTFAYDESDQVLDGISFRADGGSFVAFVGQSGEGKSTIAALLARLYVPDDGEITAAGFPIEEFDVEAWRSRIAFVRQNPYIFDTTLRENIEISNPDVTQAEVDQACEIAQITEFIDELPAGYDSELGDDGVRLSGGQRQRVALARALVKDADVLVLDEATSDLDANIEQRVQDGISSMDRDYTIVAIAHRLSTIKDADRIYAIENGKIVERGEHQHLLSNDGTYATLYSAQ